MKKLLLSFVLGSAFAGSAIAQDYARSEQDFRHSDNDGRRAEFSEHHGWDIHHDLDHLNRMLARVRAEIAQYGAGRGVRYEVSNISGRVGELNSRFRSGHFEPRRLRERIESLHSELHEVEVRMHVRPEQFYIWR
jgi:Ni/Co efflux regulator RcnB